ncbi:ubiquitinyl hydrolase [Fistulina hepatica ATCC 64428]|uniref:Ubiquitin carboxyl-terminal hydrolase n=1 Tax=Fistulina hepatica ATCC 64428 TaxID=1128425 RepID=A0A0D7APB3_9AGAR|nr:ubiquitinyl hydrolase [Fistulina hepatica ATCC 64428]
MSGCTHLQGLDSLREPTLSQAVHREECTQCFENQDSARGIDVCLSCFNGGCLDPERQHAAMHAALSGHYFTLNVKRRPKPSSQRDDEPPAKMTKLAIMEEREEDQFEWTTTVKCWQCDAAEGRSIPAEEVKSIIGSIMRAMSSARQSEVKAWEEETLACEHTLMLQQTSTEPIPASGLAHCNACDLTSNLWLCLTCGSLGCGRPLYGGTGGNGHGLEHYKTTQHPVCVKLGTITPEGGADIYCYACDDAKLDPELSTHLAVFGINIRNQTKTEKSMTELQIEHNLNYDFSLTSEDGKALEPLFGPCLTGLSNLGNSCYMASVLQTLFSLSAFQEYYTEVLVDHKHIEERPADCVECQMRKVADGLVSGRYAMPAVRRHFMPEGTPPSSSPEGPVFQEGLRPHTFKALFGRGHEEFATMRQQDAEEFFEWLLTVVRRDWKRRGASSDQDPTQVFSYGLEQRLSCTECKKVRYRIDGADVVSVAVPAVQIASTDEKTVFEDVQLTSCLDALLSPEAIPGYNCPSCNRSTLAVKQSKFATLPSVLVVHAKKFQLVNWVPTKLDIPVILPPDDAIQFDEHHMGQGLRPDEVPLPEEARTAPQVQVNELALAQLEGMGFPRIRCEKALLATGNANDGNVEAAMEWLFAHMDDPDVDAPTETAGSRGPEPSADQVAMLADMGFTEKQARKALLETGGNPERAVEWLFNHPDDDGTTSASDGTGENTPVSGFRSVPARYVLKAFISHKGPSVHSGHYVAHIRHGADWVLFNDEKVVRADLESVNALKKLAYLYVFERV